MAGDWIKVEKSTSRKPEVLRLADILGIHPDQAFGLCVRFWSWCDDHMTDGHAQSVTYVTLDTVFGHAGFATALTEVGWLRVRHSAATGSPDGSLEIPNFDRHLSESAKNRALSAGRKQKQRAKNSVEDVTETSRSKRDKSVTREEKSERRIIHPPPTPPLSAPTSGGREEKEEDSAAPSNTKTPQSSESEWTEVTRVLRSLGVGDPARAIVGAREGGSSPSDVLAVIAHYRASPGAWTPALLSGRVARCAPGLPSTEFWPPKAATAQRVPPKKTEADRQSAEDFDAMRIVKDGRRVGKTEDQIEADLARAKLGAASERLGWRDSKEVIRG